MALAIKISTNFLAASLLLFLVSLANAEPIPPPKNTEQLIAGISKKITEGTTTDRRAGHMANGPKPPNADDEEAQKKEFEKVESREHELEENIEEDIEDMEKNRKLEADYLKQYKGKDRGTHTQEIQNWHEARVGANDAQHRLEVDQWNLKKTREEKAKFAPSLQQKVHQEHEVKEGKMHEHNLQNSAWGFA